MFVPTPAVGVWKETGEKAETYVWKKNKGNESLGIEVRPLSVYPLTEHYPLLFVPPPPSLCLSVSLSVCLCLSLSLSLSLLSL